MSDVLQELQNWFAKNCNAKWEHQHGVKIETLVNPGWAVAVDLTGTTLAGVKFQNVDVSRTDDDWIQCRIKSDVFEGFGGICNLAEILNVFFTWNERGI